MGGARIGEVLTVADVLALPVVRRGLPELVAGEESVGNEVRWVHVLDVRDASGLLKGGEFVLCNGFGLGLEARTQRSFVRELAEQRAAALAVELGLLYRKALPEPLVDEATRNALPLIALHRKTRFVEVTETVHQQLVGSEFAQLRAGDELSRRLNQLLLSGGDAGALLAELARSLGNPVVLEDAAGRLVDWAGHQASGEVVLRAWQDLIEAERRDGTGGRGAREAPVRLVHGEWGRLVALELDGPLDEGAAAAVERGAEAVGVRLISRHREDELSARSRGTFLDALAHRRIDELEAARRARVLGFDSAPRAVLPVVVVRRGDRAEVDVAPLAADVRTALVRAGLGALVGAVGAQLLILVSGSGAQADPVAERLLAALDAHGLDAEHVAIVIAAPADSWIAAGSNLQRCLQHAPVAARAPASAWHDASHVALAEVLDEVAASPTLQAFIDDRLGALLAHDASDRRRRTELLRTLEVYLRHGGRKTPAAHELHIERQSLYHRLDRLAQLLDLDWNDGDAVFEVQLAMRARDAVLAARRPPPVDEPG